MSSYGRALRKIERDRARQVEYVVRTDPGCQPGDPFWELHALEVQGAVIALHEAGPWSGATLMDCGCILDLVPLPHA